MLDKETIEIIAHNFSHEFFMHYDMGDWKQIKDYGSDIPKIIRKVVKELVGYNDNDLFHEIMNEIDDIK